MPRGSEELTNARKAEIVNACAVLYETCLLYTSDAADE